MKWEYLSVSEQFHEALIEYADDYGRDGWELVSVVGGNGAPYVAFFKRPLSQLVTG